MNLQLSYGVNKMGQLNEYKVLQYDQTIGLLVEAIKELTAKVNELENK